MFEVFNIFAQNIHVGTRYNGLGEAVLTSTHNVCFESKIRKNIGTCIPLRTPVLLYKSGI